ncbi:MAG: AI-2E family transporter [Porcipelethomonas sp.]
MRFRFNSKHNAIAAYCIIVFAVCLLLVALVFKYSTFLGYFNKILSVISPVIWGICIAYLMNPFMIFCERHFKKWFCKKKQRKSLTRSLAIISSFIVFFGILAAIIGAIVPEVKTTLMDFFKSLPAYLNNLQIYLTDLISDFIEKKPELARFFNTEFSNIQEMILKGAQKLEPMLENMFKEGGFVATVTDSAWAFITGLKDFVLGIFVSIYLLYSKETFLAQATKIVYAVFPEKRRKTILRIASRTNDTFTHFLTGKAIDSLIIGILAFIGLQFMGLQSYAVLISIIIGVTNMIPFFGPFIGAIPSAVLILLTFPGKTILFIIFVLLLQQFDGNILGPKILGNSVGLSPFWIMFSIFVGGGLFGFVGMIAFVPIFAVIYGIVREIVESRLEKKELPVSTAYYLHERTEPIIQISSFKLPKFITNRFGKKGNSETDKNNDNKE